MYEGNKTMQYAFYAGVLVLFIFGLCCFSGSYFDGQRSKDIGEQLQTSQSLNSRLQKSVEDNKRTVDNSVRRIGQAETNLDRAEDLISQCEQILRTAEQRTKERNP